MLDIKSVYVHTRLYNEQKIVSGFDAKHRPIVAEEGVTVIRTHKDRLGYVCGYFFKDGKKVAVWDLDSETGLWMIDSKHPFDESNTFRVVEGTVSASDVLAHMMSQDEPLPYDPFPLSMYPQTR